MQKYVELNNSKGPLVSIITVCLNSSAYLEDSIKSVLEQVYPNIEYLIIDGGSTDGSIDILNKYRDKINKIVVEKDTGIFNAMNKGIKLATGDIIYFINSDDKFYDRKVVEEAVEAFKKFGEADFIYGNLIIFDPRDKFSYIEKYPKKVSRNIFINKTIGHPASFFRYSCFDKVGFFEESYKIASDYEWYVRAVFTNGLKGMHIDRNISIFRLGGNSTREEHMEPYFLERDLIQQKYFNACEMLCARILSGMKKILGKRGNAFLHNLQYRKV